MEMYPDDPVILKAEIARLKKIIQCLKREEEAKIEPAPEFWDPFRWDPECKPTNGEISEEGTKFKCKVTNNEGCTAICTPETTKYHNSKFKVKLTNKNYEIMIGLKP